MKLLKLHLTQIFTIAFLLIALTVTTSINAQNKITSDILLPSWQRPDSVMMINLTDVTASAEVTNSIIGEIYKSIPDTSVLSGYMNQFVKYTETKDTLISELASIDSVVLGTRSIQNYLNRLEVLKSRHSKLGSDLQSTTKDLQQKYNRIKDR